MNRFTKNVRIILGAAVLVSAVTAAMAVPVAAHGAAATTATKATCSEGFGNLEYRITAWNPTGSASGITQLAARVQQTLNGPYPEVTTGWAAFGNGYWLSTNSSQFPYGNFWNGSGWYRAETITFTPASNTFWYRVQWLIKWADGHGEYRYSQWVFC